MFLPKFSKNYNGPLLRFFTKLSKFPFIIKNFYFLRNFSIKYFSKKIFAFNLKIYIIYFFFSWECPDAPNVTAATICPLCGNAGHIAKDCKNPNPNYQFGGMDDEVYGFNNAVQKRLKIDL